MKELNKKIAKWCGFKLVKISGGDDPFYELLRPNGEQYEIWYSFRVGTNKKFDKDAERTLYPDFTTSLDACFEYIVPKLDGGIEGASRKVFLIKWITELEDGENPALALCRAVEKLIDGECEHNFVNVVNKAIPEPGLDVCTKCGKLG